MRMTRAALRAQAQTEDQPEPEHQDYIQKEQALRSRFSAYIHEDPLVLEAEGTPETRTYSTHASPVRLALRDITDENYPQADLDVEVQSQTPLKAQQEAQLQEEKQDLRKSTRKSTAKAKGRTKKKIESPVVVEVEAEISEVSEEPVPAEPGMLEEDVFDTAEEQENIEAPDEQQQAVIEEEPAPVVTEIPGPDPEVQEEEQLLEGTTRSPASRTPKFDPAIHLPEAEASASEDSFVHSITSRSPAKITQPPSEDIQQSVSFDSSLQTHTPTLRRTSSTKFEESFEAMDSLEDTIEQMTAGLPLVPAEEMDSPDSPLKVDRQSLKPQGGSVTPNSSAVRTPSTASSKLQSVVRAQDKENTPPVAKTPLAKSKTPSKAKTPLTKEATPLKTRTPSAKKPSPLKPVPASARKKTTNTTAKPAAPAAVVKKPVAPAQPPKPTRKSVMTSTTTKPQTTTRKSTLPPTRKPAPKQPLANTTNTKAEPKKPAAPEIKSHQSGMSFSNSPAKQQPNIQRRITSGGVLSTAKPGFIPSKSAKPPTTSTFALPGEAIAEKLKAQKEAREEKMRAPQPKLTLAEQKTAKLKADREAREERVRLNQMKAEKEMEEKKAARPTGGNVLTVSKARAEAAERGRLASKEWAEKMMMKKQGTGGVAV